MSDPMDDLTKRLRGEAADIASRVHLVTNLDRIKALEAQVERLTALNRVSTENHRALWVALWLVRKKLRMVRDAIEEVGPAGILPNIEHEGVEPEQIAEHFVAAISRIAALAGEGDDRA